MKKTTSLLLAIIFTLSVFFTVSAQAAETIWLTANASAYKTGETVVVAVNAISGTPIQELTFQIRYDPACLQPVSATSPIPGMNGMSLPQTPGLADATFASAAPQTANGILAEVRFLALGECQTALTLESATLAILNPDGLVAPLAGVTVGVNNIALNIGREVGTSQQPSPVAGGTPLPLGPATPPSGQFPSWLIVLFSTLAGVIGVLVAVNLLRKPVEYTREMETLPQAAMLSVMQGPQAGKKFQLTNLPCSIGRDSSKEICLNDPQIKDEHSKIFINNDRYYLMELSGATFVNDRLIKKTPALLKPGDIVRLGQGVLVLFGY